MGENNERIRIPEGAKVAVQADGTLYDEVTQNNIARLQTKTVDAEANNRLVQRENKSFTLAEGNIADLPNGTGLVKPYARKFKCRYDERDGDLMTDQRMISASQRVMTSFDKIYEKEANEILR